MQKVPEAGCQLHGALKINLAAHRIRLCFPLREKKNRHAATHRPTESQAALPRRAQGDFLLRQLSVFYEGTHVDAAAVSLIKRRLVSSHTRRFQQSERPLRQGRLPPDNLKFGGDGGEQRRALLG